MIARRGRSTLFQASTDLGPQARPVGNTASELVMADERRRVGRGGGLGAWLGLWAAVMVGGASLGNCFFNFWGNHGPIITPQLAVLACGNPWCAACGSRGAVPAYKTNSLR